MATGTPMTFTQIEFVGGSDQFINYTIVDTSGTPIDINGATIEFKLKQYGDFYNQSLITKAGTIVDAPNGLCQVTLTDTETEALNGKFVQQLQVTDFSGTVFKGQGIIVVFPAII